MKKYSAIYGLCLVLLLSFNLVSVNAQSTQAVLFAAVDGDQLYISRSGGEQRSVITESGKVYQNLTWDPELLFLLFNYADNAGHNVLAISDNMASKPTILTEKAVFALPPSFTPDSNQIIYAVYDTDVEVTGTVNVYSQSRFGGDPQMIGIIPFPTLCGVGAVEAPEIAYEAELGGSPLENHNRGVLFLSPYGLVHSADCRAEKTMLTDLKTGKSVELGQNLQWVVPSPDGTKLAGISGGGLTIIDLSLQTTTQLKTSAPPAYQVLWGAKGSNVVYYAARNMVGTINLSADALQTLAQNQVDSTMLQLWKTTIYAYDLGTQHDTLVVAQDAYAIGRMAITDDNALIYSMVESQADWVNIMASQRIDVAEPTIYDALLVPVNLYRVDLSNQQVTEVGQNIRQAAVSRNPAMG